MTPNMSRMQRYVLALGLAASPLGLATAHAQTAPGNEVPQPLGTPAPAPGAAATPTASTPQDSGQLEDIVVTAQRRSETAQSVPISLQSFSGASLQRSGVRSTEDLTNVVGGLVIQPTSSRPAVFVRGVGTNSTNTTPAVLTFVDGVYYPFGQSFDFANVASIEVLKGPQGTLFGRNATGGVIQVTTRAPSDTWGGSAEFGYGNYETVETSAYVTGPLVNGVAFDLGVRYRNQGEGFGTNIYNGDPAFYTNRAAVRGRIRANLGEAVTLTVGGDYSRVEGQVGTNVSPAFGYDVLYVGGALQTRPGPYYPGLYDINAGPLSPGFRSEEWGVNGTLEARLTGVTLRSITSYRHNLERTFIDYDGTPAPTLNFFINRPKREAVTQELQALSNGTGRFQWVVGGFYYFNHTDTDYALVSRAVSVDRDRSLAGYAQATYAILPSTRLTLGGRYTHERRSIYGYATNLAGVETPGRRGGDAQTFNEFTWRVALDQNITRDILVYASVSRGFNGGFFSESSFGGFANRAQNPAVLPEFLTSYEVGLKSDLLNRHLRLNLSAFRYDYSNLQQQIYDQGTTKTINAANARIQGIDFEVVLRPVSALTLSVSGTYLDPKYRSYPQAPNYVRQPNGSIVAIGSIDTAGNYIVNAPRISFTATASYAIPTTSAGTFTTTANYYYRGRTYADPTDRYPLTNPSVVNLSERWDLPGSHVYLSAWAKNLTNEHYDYAINILAPAGLVGNVAPPRTYGGTIGFNF